MGHCPTGAIIQTISKWKRWVAKIEISDGTTVINSRSSWFQRRWRESQQTPRQPMRKWVIMQISRIIHLGWCWKVRCQPPAEFRLGSYLLSSNIAFPLTTNIIVEYIMVRSNSSTDFLTSALREMRPAERKKPATFARPAWFINQQLFCLGKAMELTIDRIFTQKPHHTL